MSSRCEMATDCFGVLAGDGPNGNMPVDAKLEWNAADPAELILTARPGIGTGLEYVEIHWHLARSIVSAAIANPGEFYGEGDVAICYDLDDKVVGLPEPIIRVLLRNETEPQMLVLDASGLMGLMVRSYLIVSEADETDFDLDSELSDLLGAEPPC